MLFEIETRPSDSPFVEQVWQARSAHSGFFHSLATNHWLMVVTRRNGKMTFTVRGPETKATSLACAADGEWVGIRLRIGSFMPVHADTFIDRLVRQGLLLRDPVVDDVLHGRLDGRSERTVQRRFVQATGLTQGHVCRVERARSAMALLQRGVSILDTVHKAGYYDQPHLTRSVKRLLGQTPSEIAGTSSLF